MPPLQDMVRELGLDDPQQATAPTVDRDVLDTVRQRYPRFAQAMAEAQDSIRINLTGPNILGPPDTVPQLSLEQAQAQLPGSEGAQPSLLERAGAFLSKGDLPQRLTKAYTEHGPEALGQGLSEFTQALETHAPQGRVPWSAVAPSVNKAIGGAMTTALPLALPEMAAHPLTTLFGGLVASGLSGGTEALAEHLGVDPETTALLGNAAGFISPSHLVAAALPFAPYARKMLMSTLEKEAASRVTGMLAENPALAPALPWMHPSEVVALSKMSPEARAEFGRVIEALPSGDFLAALGRAGHAKLGWYEHSRAAIQHVYGDEADLFAGVLAATSPQNSVEMNLENATNVFRGWVQAGRPTDEASILKIMGANVRGEKGEKSALDSWKNNTVQVLQGGKAISGPKVDSFWRNLRNRAVLTPYGEMRPEDAVTLDAWMSNVLGMKQTYFSGQGASGKSPAAVALRKKQLAGLNPGYGPGYLAATAAMREAATKGGLTPEQLQETIWSWGKALYEQSEKTKISAVDIIKNQLLDPERVAGTPDFSTLFTDPRYAPAIKATSKTHAARLATLQPAEFPQALPSTPKDHAWQLKAAAVLDKLRASRDLSSDLRVGTNQPNTIGVTAAQEGMPGKTTRVAPELATEKFTQNQRDALARSLLKANTDVRGENILIKAMGLPTAESTVGIGQWTPPGGGPTEYNTLDAAGSRVRINPAWQRAIKDPAFLQEVAAQRAQMPGVIHPADAARYNTALRLQGLLDAQDAVGSTGVIYDINRKDTLHVFTPNKVKKDVFEGLTKILPTDYALVNKGGGTPGHVIDVIRLDGQPVGTVEAELVRGYLSGFNQKKMTITPGTNAAGIYLDLPWESGPGSQQVTAKALEFYDELPAGVKARLDGPEVRAMAARKLKIWQTEGAKRGLTVPEDYASMLRLVAQSGIGGLKRSLANPEQLVPSLLLLGLGRFALESRQTPDGHP